MRALLLATILTPLAWAAGPLGPDASPIAVSRYKTGIKLYRAADYKGAAREFTVALGVMPNSAKLAYNAARSFERADDPREAIRLYQRYLELAPDAKDRADVEAVVATLEQLAPEEKPKATEPTPPAAEPIPPPQQASAEVAPASWVGWGLSGAGVVGLAVGGAFYGQAASARDEARSVRGFGNPDRDGLQDDFDEAQTLSWVGFGLGAALLGTGVALLLFDDDDATVSFVPGPWPGVVGRF